MYLPRHFEESHPQALAEFIRQHPLATLITIDAGKANANHIPMLVQCVDGAPRLLQAHVARANPLWKTLHEQPMCLAVFQHTGTYVTPTWYPSKRTQGGKVVPTWNYVAVHVSGRARSVEDPAWLRNFLEQLTQVHESGRPEPWSIADAPADYVDRQLRAIVGIEIEIASIAGKWKVSQNRSDEDALGVAQGLQERGIEGDLTMADWVKAYRP